VRTAALEAGFTRLRPVMMTAFAMMHRDGTDGAWSWRGGRAERALGRAVMRRTGGRDVRNIVLCPDVYSCSASPAAAGALLMRTLA